jgi:hypothetical protein
LLLEKFWRLERIIRKLPLKLIIPKYSNIEQEFQNSLAAGTRAKLDDMSERQITLLPAQNLAAIGLYAMTFSGEGRCIR